MAIRIAVQKIRNKKKPTIVTDAMATMGAIIGATPEAGVGEVLLVDLAVIAAIIPTPNTH